MFDKRLWIELMNKTEKKREREKKTVSEMIAQSNALLGTEDDIPPSCDGLKARDRE